MRMQTAVFAAALLSLTAVQAEETTTITPIKAIAVESEVSGEVTIVNTETRMLTIRKDDGVFEVLHAPPEVERLDEIKIGDKLTLTKSTAALIELEQGRDAGGMGTIAKTEVQRDTGSTPGGTITDSATLYGQIVGVDKGAGTVTITGANRTETYTVADKSLLTELNVKKGDGVIVTIRNEISGQIKR
jgi:hypothetical protein